MNTKVKKKPKFKLPDWREMNWYILSALIMGLACIQNIVVGDIYHATWDLLGIIIFGLLAYWRDRNDRI